MVTLDIMVVMAMIIDYHCSHARHVHHGHQDRQENQDKRADRTFKLDFPGNLCRAAFAILAMFHSIPHFLTASIKYIEKLD